MPRQDRVDELRRTTLDLAAAIGDPATGDETFDRYLNWIANFHCYSFGNIGLILSACPSATYVAGFKTWKRLGRHVKRGEKGIPILVPMRSKPALDVDPQTNEETVRPGHLFFSVAHVFDASQTAGDGSIPSFKVDLGGEARPLLMAGVMLAEKQGIEVVTRPLFGSTNGLSQLGRVVLNSSRPDGVIAQTMVHELAHEILHGLAERQALAEALAEAEAEAVSVVVMRAFGLDVVSNGAAYIRSHGATRQVILHSLDRITTTARTIIDGLKLELGAAVQLGDILSATA
jgi:hypothetical protein